MDRLKYIKLENEDGSYSDSIPLAVDSDHVDVNGNTLTNELNNKANISNINNLQSQINGLASGSPAGVYETVSALIAADPDHSKIYLVSADGHWYYYGGSAWSDGGVYQATVNSDLVNQLKNNLEIEMENQISSYNDYPNNVGFFSTTGYVIVDNKYVHKVIPVRSGQKIKMLMTGRTFYAILKDYLTPITTSTIPEFSSETAYNDRIELPNNTMANITVPSDGKYLLVMVKYNNIDINFRTLIIDDTNLIDPINKRINNKVNGISNLLSSNTSEPITSYFNYPVYSGFFNSTGYIINDAYMYKVIPVRPGQNIKIKMNGRCFYGILKDYSYAQSGDIPNFSSDTNYNTYKEIPNNTIADITVPSDGKYLLITTKYNNVESTNIMFTVDNIDCTKSINERLNEKSNKIDITYNCSPLSAFNNIVCIGDSLTYSQVGTAPNSKQAQNPYPKILAHYLGVDNYQIIAESGASAAGLWASHNKELQQKTNQLAIIYLGTNGGLTDTVDTDCPVGVSYPNFASTQTGSLGKWIAKSQALGCKVLLLKPYYNGLNLNEVHSAIDHLAERFGCATIKAPDGTNINALMYVPSINGTSYPHYNQLGYAWFAKRVADDVINNAGETLINIIPD